MIDRTTDTPEDAGAEGDERRLYADAVRTAGLFLEIPRVVHQVALDAVNRMGSRKPGESDAGRSLRLQRAVKAEVLVLVEAEYGPQLRRIARSKQRNPEDAEDMVQQAFINFLSRSSKGCEGGSLWALLTECLNNAIRDKLEAQAAAKRSRYRTVALPENLDRMPPDPCAEAVDQQLMVAELLAPLDAMRQLVLTLRHVHDYTVEKVADMTGLTARQVKHLQASGERRLREAVARESVEEGGPGRSGASRCRSTGSSEAQHTAPLESHS